MVLKVVSHGRDHVLDGRGGGLEEGAFGQHLFNFDRGEMGCGVQDRLAHFGRGVLALHAPRLVQGHMRRAAPVGLVEPPLNAHLAKRRKEDLRDQLLETQLLAVLDDYVLGRLMGLDEFLVPRLARRRQRLADALGHEGRRFRR